MENLVNLNRVMGGDICILILAQGDSDRNTLEYMQKLDSGFGGN